MLLKIAPRGGSEQVSDGISGDEGGKREERERERGGWMSIGERGDKACDSL